VVSLRLVDAAYAKSFIYRSVRVLYLQVCSLTRRQPITGDAPVVVSLTTFGRRLKYVHLTIESIAAGAQTPRRVILWISDGLRPEDLSSGLRRLQRRGLEVRFVEDVGPHTKYYPYLHEASAHHLPLVTSDDDTLYKRDWLKTLVAAVVAHEDEIVVHRAHRFGLDARGVPKPYASWLPVRDRVARYSNFGTGVSGAYYPVAFLALLKSESKEFAVRSPRADDVWLHSRAVKFGFKTRQVSDVPRSVVNIPLTQRIALNKENVTAGTGNDQQIANCYDKPTLDRISADA
jgi:hypothetical protein